MSTDDLQSQIQTALLEMKSVIDEKVKDVITEDKFDKVATEVKNLQLAQQKVEQENLALKSAMQMTGMSQGNNAPDEQEAKARDLTLEWLRTGSDKALTEIKGLNLESKALGTYSTADGGVLVPKLMSAKIVKKVFETTPMRLLASTDTIAGDSIEYLLDDNEMSAGWVGETDSRPETNTAAIGKKTIAVHELYASPKASQRLLDDAVLDLESWMAEKVSDKIARTENTAFISGTGTASPRGILTYTAGSGTYDRSQVEQVNLGHATTLTGNGLIELQNSLKAFYQPQAKWLMSQTSYGVLQKLMYTDNKFNALTAGSINSEGFTLLGKQVVIGDDMPDVAANALSVAYGDFTRGYQILDRKGITMLRDPYSAKPHVLFYVTKRTGGDVLNTEALKIGKVAA